MTLGQALAAKVRLIVWCKSCWHRAEPDVTDQVDRYGEGTTVIDWAARLRCSACEGYEVDFVVSGSGTLTEPRLLRLIRPCGHTPALRYCYP
jgi:hypothetical protein